MLAIHVSMVGLVPIMDHHSFAHVLLGLQESAVKRKVRLFCLVTTGAWPVHRISSAMQIAFVDCEDNQFLNK